MSILTPYLSLIIAGQTVSNIYSYQVSKNVHYTYDENVFNQLKIEQEMLNQEKQNKKIPSQLSEKQQQQQQQTQQQELLQLRNKQQFLKYYADEIVGHYNVPIFFAAVFGGFFVPKLMTGLVGADFCLRVLMNLDVQSKLKEGNFKYRIYSLESSPIYNMQTILYLMIYGAGPFIPLKFLMTRKLK